MTKSLILLILFCLIFCAFCTACTNIDNTTDNTTENTTSGTTENEVQSTSDSLSDSTQETTTASTKNTDNRNYYLKELETKELKTESPELQEKIDRNVQDLSPEYQQKLIIQIGDQRDVPYIILRGGGMQLDGYGMNFIYLTPDFSARSFSGLQSKEEYMPTYIYTGTEEFVIELNDKKYSDYSKFSFTVNFYDGSETKYFTRFEDIYENLPKGKYYVHFEFNLCGHWIVTKNGSAVDCEYLTVSPAFILELQ